MGIRLKKTRACNLLGIDYPIVQALRSGFLVLIWWLLFPVPERSEIST